jgi:hypothetical protein
MSSHPQRHDMFLVGWLHLSARLRESPEISCTNVSNPDAAAQVHRSVLLVSYKVGVLSPCLGQGCKYQRRLAGARPGQAYAGVT